MSDDQKITQKVVKSDCQFVDIHRDPRFLNDDQTILKKFQKSDWQSTDIQRDPWVLSDDQNYSQKVDMTMNIILKKTNNHFISHV